MRLVAYLRRSREDDAYGLSSQESEIHQWSDQHGHEIVSVCTDNGVMGNLATADRPGLTEALALVGASEAEGIVCHSKDRLARALHVEEAILQEVWRLGGRMFTTIDGEILQDDPDDPMRTFVRQVTGAVAQLQRAQMIANMRRGKREKARHGGYTGGKRFHDPYGYERQVIGETTKGKPKYGYIPVEAEQKVIRLASDLRSNGRTLQEIAEILMEQGHPTKAGGSWHANSVRRLLPSTPCAAN